jgi:hypothetical protein
MKIKVNMGRTSIDETHVQLCMYVCALTSHIYIYDVYMMYVCMYV